MNATTITRREFLRHSAIVAAPFIVPATVFGANERIGIAVIGPGRQGGGLLASAGRSKDARIVALADVNLVRARERAKSYKAEVFKDYRKLLERKDVDAVITATPEHWRALTCIHACQAGKDVYAENWDPVKEVFPDDADANQYLDRARRKPYELPETI
ncbi:MAG: Gfo/Idh/MocA family oxidoreductase [Verrucomicrobia bacterium]|nr:Gfo/Idh/MocA family oxidoreductase [Verrucomicrobiota bacterium]